MKKIFLFALHTLSLTILFLGFWLFYIIHQIENNSMRLEETKNINEKASLVVMENYYTQLGFWEYLYDPTLERAASLEKYEDDLFLKIDDLLNASKNAKYESVYINGNDEINGVHDDIVKIMQNLEPVKDNIAEYISKKSEGADDIYLKSLDEEIKKTLYENKNFFDDLDFNSRLEKVKNNQTLLTKEIWTENQDFLKKSKYILILESILYLFFYLSVIIFLGMRLKMLKKQGIKIS